MDAELDKAMTHLSRTLWARIPQADREQIARDASPEEAEALQILK